MANTINAFPLTVYHDSVSIDAPDRARMVEAILAMGTQTIQQTRGSSWTGDTNGFEFLHRDERFQSLFERFADPVNRYLDALGVDDSKVILYYTRSWGTISRRGEATRPHNHSQSHISLVYYLQKPADSSGISFINHDAPNQFAPNIFNEHMLQCGILKEIQQLNARTIYLNPKEDDVLLFPSKAVHAIVPNGSEQLRISVAVDILVTVKESKGLEFVLPNLETWKAVG